MPSGLIGISADYSRTHQAEPSLSAPITLPRVSHARSDTRHRHH
jgi:hypothetical protein